MVNRDHPLRRLISKPLQISFLRNFVLKSNIVEQIKSKNKRELVKKEISHDELFFCNQYFKQDLSRLKNDFGIEF